MNNRARATSVFTSEITLPVVVQAGYRFKNLSKGENSNSLQIFMAFSGGGSRAAAFSYGVLEGDGANGNRLGRATQAIGR